MDFPIGELLDEAACYARLVALIHPRGLTCPRCGSGDLRVHRRTRDPVLDYRCPGCKRVFNAFTHTAFHKMQYRPSRLVLILRGIAQGATTARLAREIGASRTHLLTIRHRLQANALAHREAGPLEDDRVEADEMYQNAGEKRGQARRGIRPAPAAGQQVARPGVVGRRPAAGAGGRRPGERAHPPAGGAAGGGGAAGAGGAGGGAGRGGGLHRRVVGV
jgi:transposase-like protein